MNNEYQKTEQAIQRATQNVRLSDIEKARVRNNLQRIISTEQSVRVSWFSLAIVRYAVAPALIVFVIVGGVTGASASTLPGDMLYPVKVSVLEEVRGLLHRNTENRLSYEQQRVEKRLAELAELDGSGELNSEKEVQALVYLDRHINAVQNRSKSLPPEVRVKTDSDVEATLRAQERIFAELQEAKVQEHLQGVIARVVQSRALAEQALYRSENNLAHIASDTEREVKSVIREAQDRLSDSKETRLLMQTSVHIELALQATEEGDRYIQAGSFADAIVQFEKGKRVVKEAMSFFDAGNRYAFGHREIPSDAVALLREKTEVVEIASAPVESDSLMMSASMSADVTALSSVVYSESPYEYFEETLRSLAGRSAVPETYINIFTGIKETDFNGVIGAGGVYQVTSGELQFIETASVTDSGLVRTIESEGYIRLLINIASRLRIELATVEDVDRIISILQQTEDEPARLDAPEEESSFLDVELDVLLQRN